MFSKNFCEGLRFRMHYKVLIFVARWRQYFRQIAVKNCEKSKNRRKRLCAPFRIDSWMIWRKFHCSSLGPRTSMHLYRNFSACRYIAQTAIVEIRISSPKRLGMRTNGHPASKVNFPKHLWGYYTREWLWLCTYIAVFLCCFRWRHSKPPNFRTAFSGQFYIQFQEG